MRILYAYEFDFLDSHRQSGRPWQVRRALAERGHEIVDLPNVLNMAPDRQLLEQAFWRVFGRIQRRDREPARLTAAARTVERAFTDLGCDIVVAPSTIPVAYARPDLPVFEVLDAFFRYNLDRYDSFSNLTPSYRRDGLACDDLAMAKSSGMVAPTEDLARAMVETRQIGRDRVRVCPWGPNLTPSQSVLEDDVLKARFEARRILFVGREWRRKGFDVVLDALRSPSGQGFNCLAMGLEAKNVPAALLKGLQDRVTFLGELSLGDPEQRRQAERAFADASLLVVPTRAENFGITFVEALNFGLPIVTFSTDGLSSVLSDLPCATLLPVGSNPAAFADAIAEAMSSLSNYSRLCKAAVAGSARFSWAGVAAAIEELVQLGPRHS